MTSMAIWDFAQAHNRNTAFLPKSYGFREFLEKLYGNEAQSSAEVISLFGQAKKIFNLNSIQEAFDYLETRISDDLAELFPLITSNLYLSQEQVDQIRSTLEHNLLNIYPLSSNTGLNECVALYLKGLFELNFDQSFEYAYKGIFNISGSVIPFLKGKITQYEDTNFQDVLDYQDRVLFSIISHEVVSNIKATAINGNIFTNAFHSELGNNLCHNVDLFGLYDGRYYNYMRIMLDHRELNLQSRHICESTTHNLFYTVSTTTLEQASKENDDLDVDIEFDKYFAKTIEALCITKLSTSVTGVDNFPTVYIQYLHRLYKDFLYIQSLMPKYLSSTQLTALRRHYIDAAYLILRNTLHAVIYKQISLDSIELVNYSIAKHLEIMVFEEYGIQNKYAHLIYCFNELHDAVNSPIKFANLNEYFFWFNPTKTNTNAAVHNAFEIASQAGSISAKMNLSLAYYMNNQKTAANKGKAAVLELEMMQMNVPIHALGVTVELDSVLTGKTELPGMSVKAITEYINRKIDNFDFSRPDMLLRYRDAHQEKVRQNLGESENYTLNEEQTAEYFNTFANKFPFVKNIMLLLSQATEATAIWSIAAQTGCSYSNAYLFHASDIQAISAFPFNFDDLINSDLTGYLLNPINWNLYAFSSKNLKNLESIIGGLVCDKYYESCENALKTFSEYENYIGEIIKSGKLPTIEQVGIFINLYFCGMLLSKNLVRFPYTGDKAKHKEISEKLHTFWLERSCNDWTVLGHTRLSDIFSGRSFNNSNHLLHRMLLQFNEIRMRPELENILVSPALAIKWADSLSEYLPNYDSPLGVSFGLYMQWCTQTLEASCKLDNHIDSCTLSYWMYWLYALMFLHSSCYYDVEQHIQRKNMSREDIQIKTLGINQHKKFVVALRRYLKNGKPLNECVIQFKRILGRGSITAAEIYHAIVKGNMTGRSEFFPQNTQVLMRVATTIAQTETLHHISPNKRSVITPYMMLILIMRLTENNDDTLETREYLLNRLVEHKDAMGLVFNVYDAYHNEHRTSSTGHTIEEAVALVREHAIAHRSTIQLLGIKTDDLTIKFPQSKVKYKLAEITPNQWLEAFGLSTEYFSL